MSENKHTHGPWQRVGWKPCGIYGRGGLVDAVRICQIDDRLEHDADARLIAAAPELLDACKALRNSIMHRSDPQLCDWVDGVIAKAEGRS
jgi:hypothetical protein